MASPEVQKVFLVTGASGAGRTTAVQALEDFGFEAIDNLPLSLIPRLLTGPALNHPLAFGIDVRTRGFSADAILKLLDQLSARDDIDVELLFLECRPDILIRRYSETRRRHPLAAGLSPMAGIKTETELLAPVRARADMLIDTSDLSPHDLKAALAGLTERKTGDRMTLSVHSFSYKRGVPCGVDLVFDVRFLRNPHWQEDLRALTGLDAKVRDYIAEDPRFAPFQAKLDDLIRFLLPAYVEEGKAHLAIGFGCTGGKHRSVTMAEIMAKTLADAGWQVSTRHREL
ncbi:MAG: RNase adapter RapZ [Rhodobacterales bacterium]|nr:MAG: RNase adapter RapZ [Rhodobacterales bacterium]